MGIDTFLGYLFKPDGDFDTISVEMEIPKETLVNSFYLLKLSKGYGEFSKKKINRQIIKRIPTQTRKIFYHLWKNKIPIKKIAQLLQKEKFVINLLQRFYKNKKLKKKKVVKKKKTVVKTRKASQRLLI